MSDNLYFIPLIAEAMRRPDPKTAMVEAFDRIRELGRQPRYRVGYRQFLQFMDSAKRSLRRHAPEKLGPRILRAAKAPTSVTLLLETADTVVGTCVFEQALGTQTIGNVGPGEYRLSADTGRVLWRGSLTRQELLWAEVFPRRRLPMAADTGSSKRKPTREITLLDGTLVLRVYPGIEAGLLEIALKARREKA